MGLFSRRQNDDEDSPFVSVASGKASRRAPAREAGEPLDPAETQKRRARRRLIGATVLVLTVIVFLPMLFDPGPKPLGDDIVVQIPDKESAFNPAVPAPGKTAPAKSAPEGGSTSAAPAAPAAAAVAGTAAGAVAAGAAAVAAAPSAVPAGTAAAPAGPAAAAAPAAPAKAAPAAAPAPAPAKTEAPKKDDGARALAMLEGKSDGKAAPAPAKTDARTDAKADAKSDTKAEARSDAKSDHWAVQIGAFASADKVKDLRAKLNTAGLKSYTETLKTPQGDRIRVRVGPYPTRAEAEKAKERVKKHLVMDGTVVSG